MTPRHSSFIAPHKGLRLCFAEVLVSAGRTDPDDSAAVTELVGKARELFHLLELHADDENAVILAGLEDRVPAGGDHDRADHLRLEALQGRLVPVLEAIAERPTAEALHDLYGGLQELFAHHLLHMREEETATQVLLWKHFSDAELAGMRDAILARLGPENAIRWFIWIFPAMRPQEARPLLHGVLASPDRDFADRAAAAIRTALGPARWAALTAPEAQPA